MAKLDLSEKFKGLKDKVNTTEVSTPMQKVVIDTPKKATRSKVLDIETDEPFTFWSSKDKLMEVKVRALKEGISAKQLINNAIDMYLNT